MAYAALISSFKTSFCLPSVLVRHFQTFSIYPSRKHAVTSFLRPFQSSTVCKNYSIPLLFEQNIRDFHFSVSNATLDRHHHLREDLQKLHKENDPTLASQELSKNFEDEDVLAMYSFKFL